MTDSTFFEHVRTWVNPLKQKQVDGFNHLLKATLSQSLTHRAYIMATAWHETDATMQPIVEYGKGRGKPYGKIGKHGQAQYGRGYVQLTWDANYERADAALGLGGTLVQNFDLALLPEISARILVQGMLEGWFTSKKLSDYLSSTKKDYVGARRIVNGTDKARLIAAYALRFEQALS